MIWSKENTSAPPPKKIPLFITIHPPPTRAGAPTPAPTPAPTAASATPAPSAAQAARAPSTAPVAPPTAAPVTPSPVPATPSPTAAAAELESTLRDAGSDGGGPLEGEQR